MTVKKIYEIVLIELSKVQAPFLKLYDFNYFINQAICQFVNKIYNIYDINQQTTDDLRVLKSKATLIPEIFDDEITEHSNISKYIINMPDDYLHLLNCICYFKNNIPGCNNKIIGANKITADSLSEILNDYYNKPSINRPYYYIHNQNDNENLPTNSETDKLNDSKGFKRTFNYNGESLSTVDKLAGIRYSNTSKVRIELYCGKSDNFNLSAVTIDYLKSPQYVELTQEQLDSIQDISQIMEFPEYVNQEIINELVNLIMRRNNDPSLATHIQMTQSIARPTGQQQ